jgi:PAS domain S-box-containing protein
MGDGWEQELADALFKHAPVGLALLDRDLHFVRVNQILADINGVPLEEHAGRTVKDVIPEFAPMVEPLLRSIIEGGEPIIRLPQQGPASQGEHPDRLFEVSFYPIDRAGRCVGVLGIVNDVTSRVEAEEELRNQARVVFEAVVQNLAIAQMALEQQDQATVKPALERALSAAKHFTSDVLLRKGTSR